MPTLMKLLLISMVANNRSGLSSKLTTLWEALVCNTLSLFFCDGSSEKNATSDPDTMADKISRIKIINITEIIPGVMGLK